MNIFRFDLAAGKNIEAYGSSGFTLSKIARLPGESDIKCAYLPKGIIGYHQAAQDQLFLVVQGEGWVRGESPETRRPIQAGQAAFWEAGEWHESGTETGMVAILIEGENIDPAKTMPPV